MFGFRAVIAATFLIATAACSGANHAANQAAFLPAASTADAVAADASATTNVVKNPGFESGLTDWQQCGSVTAKAVTGISHNGDRAALVGSTGWPEIDGTSAICQTVTVPHNGHLQFYVRQDTDDEIEYANQSARIRSAGGATLKLLYKVASQTNGFQLRGPYNLSEYAGQKVTLEFAATGTGSKRYFVGQYIDDVSLTNGAAVAEPTPTPAPIPGNTPIKHIIFVLQENRTFDNIFHGYPGANYATSGLDHNGNVIALHETPLMVPYDPGHAYEDWLTEYDGGLMDGFDEDYEDVSGGPVDFAYAYAKQSDVQPYWDLAKQGVLGDETFAGHRSQSYAGHLYPIAGASGPIDDDDPDWYVANNPDGGGSCAEPGTGEAVNIVSGDTGKRYTSCFNFETLGDLLDEKHVSWRYYVDSSDKEGTVSGFASIKHIYDSNAWNNVVTPETTIFSDLQNGTLPAVSWVIGTFANSDHAGQEVPSSNGPTWVASVFNAVGASKYWKDSAVILAYDDWGGWYDLVYAITWDAYEPGFRIPLVIVSPYAKRGYISHNFHSTGSILRFIEKTYGLGSLHTIDARSDAFDDVFDFSQAPLTYQKVKLTGSFEHMVETNLPQYGAHPQDAQERD